MGQGLYTAVLFGVLDFDKSLLKEPDNMTDKEREYRNDFGITGVFWNRFREVKQSLDKNFRTSYECEQEYIGICVAVDDGWLQDWWKVPDLNHEKINASCGTRKGVYIGDDYDDKSKYDAQWDD